MSAAVPLLRRTAHDTLHGQLADIQKAGNVARLLQRRYPALASVETTLLALLERLSGEKVSGPAPAIESALSAVRTVFAAAPDGDRREIADVERVLAAIAEQRAAMEACTYTERRT